MLTAEQVASFRRDGFVFVPGFYDSLAIADVDGWVNQLAELPEVPGQHWVYREESLKEPGRRLVQRIEKFVEVHPDFARFIRRGRMQAAASALLDEPAVLFKEKINFKLPGGQGFKAHQDMQAGWSAYAPFFLTALVAIDPMTTENGCLEMAAGWHRRGLIGPEWQPLDEAVLAKVEFSALSASPGDALFFDSFAPHRSDANLSDSPRRILYVTYNGNSAGDQRERYFADKHRSFPPDIERTPGKTYVFRV